MSVINILSPHVADMIAAGEVVERPASVIKELVENSIDAGAKNITVEIKRGGMSYIRVTDDGCGMAPEDAGIAFQRHATSKLHDENGLAAIGTMGFRGEALAAISSVSKIELTTRQRGDDAGTFVTLEGGDIMDMGAAGCPDGTTMIVRDLFYNTPARLKFMKSDRSETSSCQAAALRCALGHPEISVRFIKDGEEGFFSPGDGRPDSCAYSLLGREIAGSFLPCSGGTDGIRVSGFIASPAAARGNRTHQYFFCNGRYFRSQLIQSALEQAYRNSLLVGRYPSCVLYISIALSQVDVNVHPAKTEIKFTSEKAVFDAVYYSVLSALAAESRPVEIEISPSTAKTVSGTAPNPDFYRTIPASEYKSAAEQAEKHSAATASAPRTSYSSARPSESAGGSVLSTFKTSYHTATAPETPVRRESAPAAPAFTPAVPAAPSVPKPSVPEAASQDIGLFTEDVQNPVQNVEKSSTPFFRLVGEVMKTYIIVEAEGKMMLIDKHAAHERVIFDRLRAQKAEPSSQILLTPVTYRPQGADFAVLESNCEFLNAAGFDIEEYGTEDFIIRAVPADMDATDVVPAVEEICHKLREGKRLDPAEAREEILHTVACKAAIKAGWNTHPDELKKLAEEVVSGRVKYCPHGRPVAITLSRTELDKLFKRIV